MTNEDLISQLRVKIPEILARELVDHFMAIRRDTVTATLGRSSPGKFVETVVQVLQHFESGSYDTAPKVDAYLKNLESRLGGLTDDLRLAVPRVGRAMYTLRNKRGIAHKGTMDPHIFDLRYLYASAQWILSELVRHISGSDVETANYMVERIQLPADALVEDFGDRRLVLTVGTVADEVLILLHHYYPQYVAVSQIFTDMDRRNRNTVYKCIRAARAQKLIEGDKAQGYKLTRTGYNAANAIVGELSAITDG